jgi:hypothetical protein
MNSTSDVLCWEMMRLNFHGRIVALLYVLVVVISRGVWYRRDMWKT